jgi:hypothetical protein
MVAYVGSPRIGVIDGCWKTLITSYTVNVDVILPSLLVGTSCPLYYIYLALVNREKSYLIKHELSNIMRV